MPTSCAVALCTNIGRKESHLSFFSFPKEPSVRKKWIFNCFREDDNFNPNTSYVCSEHFEESDFENFLKVKLVGGKLLLKKHAFPKLKLLKRCSEEIPGASRSKRFKKYHEEEIIDNLVIKVKSESLLMDDHANISNIPTSPIMTNNDLLEQYRAQIAEMAAENEVLHKKVSSLNETIKKKDQELRELKRKVRDLNNKVTTFKNREAEKYI